MPPLELEEVPAPIAGGLGIHRKQLTSGYLDTESGEVKRGRIIPADRVHLRAWLARFGGRHRERAGRRRSRQQRRQHHQHPGMP
jgi:hypothetical protein